MKAGGQKGTVWGVFVCILDMYSNVRLHEFDPVFSCFSNKQWYQCVGVSTRCWRLWIAHCYLFGVSFLCLQWAPWSSRCPDDGSVWPRWFENWWIWSPSPCSKQHLKENFALAQVPQSSFKQLLINISLKPSPPVLDQTLGDKSPTPCSNIWLVSPSVLNQRSTRKYQPEGQVPQSSSKQAPVNVSLKQSPPVLVQTQGCKSSSPSSKEHLEDQLAVGPPVLIQTCTWSNICHQVPQSSFERITAVLS